MDVENTGENKELQINPKEYPFEFINAQVQFATRWSELNHTSFDDALRNNTAISKNVVLAKADEKWQAILDMIHKTNDPAVMSKIIYDYYVQQPQSNYPRPLNPDNASKYFGFFTYDYLPANPLNEGKKYY